MANTKIKIRGLDESLRALRKLPDGIAEKGGGSPLAKGMRAGATVLKREVESQVSSRGPGVKNERTGNIRLKNSVRLVRDPEPERENFTERFIVGFRAKAFWALFQERGTEKQPANPILSPAFDSSKTRVIDVVRETMSKRVDSLIKKLKKS